jgi:hypothetical protein
MDTIGAIVIHAQDIFQIGRVGATEGERQFRSFGKSGHRAPHRSFILPASFFAQSALYSRIYVEFISASVQAFK